MVFKSFAYEMQKFIDNNNQNMPSYLGLFHLEKWFGGQENNSGDPGCSELWGGGW